MKVSNCVRQVARILMCEPSHFEVTYSINPWMTTDRLVDKALAMKQWTVLKNKFEECGAKTEVMKGEPGLPDLVFTANAALVYKNKAWLSNFYNEERKPEALANGNWLKAAGFQVFQSDTEYEGAGDSLFAGKKLFAGHGFRTMPCVYDEIKKEMLEPHHEMVLCELISDQFYHIDTAFCPLNSDLAAYFPEAFSRETQEKLKQHLELIPIPAKDANRLACNMVVIDKHVVLNQGNDDTCRLLEKAGFTAHQVDVSEFVKAGGACKCLSLRID